MYVLPPVILARVIGRWVRDPSGVVPNILVVYAAVGLVGSGNDYMPSSVRLIKKHLFVSRWKSVTCTAHMSHELLLTFQTLFTYPLLMSNIVSNTE